MLAHRRVSFAVAERSTWLQDEEAVLSLEMVNDRNLTVHTYNEEVAIKIHKNLPQYNKLLHQWVERMIKTLPC